MTAPVADSSVYTDVRGLNSLKQAAKTQDPKAIREAARQFESLFTSMMLKSMRDANFKDPNFGSDQGDFYQGMFDDQLAVQMSKGHGLGLADMLVQQMTRAGMVPGDSANKASKAGDASSSGVKTGAAARGATGIAGHGVGTAGSSGASGASSIAAAAAEAAAAAASAGGAGSGAGGAAASSPTARSHQFAGPARGSAAVTSSAGGTTTNFAPDTSSDTSDASVPTAAEAVNSSISTPQSDFVKALWPAAQAAGQALGVDPKHILAQAALETGWGRAVPADSAGRTSFNLFGIKAGSQWTGASVGVRTLEFSGGVPSARVDKFRAYFSTADSVKDYVSLLRGNPRYAAALNTGSDAKAFASALQQGGYSTDPTYASKLTAIAQNLDGMTSGLKSADARPINPSATTL